MNSNAETVEPIIAFDVVGLSAYGPTYSRSQSTLTCPRTVATRLVIFPDDPAHDLLVEWKDRIESLVAELLRKSVEDYVERRFRLAEESEGFEYVPETITAASAARVRRIKETQFSAEEKFVIYDDEERKSFF